MKETPIEKLAKEKVDFIDYFNNHIAGCKPGVGKLGKATICPFHDDTDPSFHYWDKIKGFRCFGCGATGDVIRAYQLHSKLYHNRVYSRVAAAKALLDMYKIDYSALEEDVTDKEKSIFELYKKEYLELTDFRPKKGVMTLIEFKYHNHNIINDMEDEDIEVRIQYFDILDRRAALVLGDYVENT